MKLELDQRKSFVERQERLREERDKNQREMEIERRRNPKTKEDFQLLERELEGK